MSEARYSEQFSSGDAEVTYEACDGIRFRVHSVFLTAHSGVLAPPIGSVLEDIVHLSEPSIVLEVLFQFIYPAPPPELDLWPASRLNLIAEVAEAAEKYQVFPAMYACMIEMGDQCSSFPIMVLAHALKHDYYELANKAALYAIDVPSQDVMAVIPAEFHDSWLSYSDRWVAIRENIISEHIPRLGLNLNSLTPVLSSFRLLQTFDSTAKNVELGEVISSEIASIPLLVGAKTHFDDSASSDSQDEAPDSSNDTIRLGSSDGKTFSVRGHILTSCAPGFLDLITNGTTGRFSLPETLVTIDLLLQFVRGRRVPDLASLTFSELLQLAYMAERFKFYQAMNLCRISIKKSLPENVSGVFYYAATFRYKHLLNNVAPLLMEQEDPNSVVLDRLPRDIAVAWAKYYQHWQTVRHTAYKIALEEFDIPGNCDCYGKPNFVITHTYPLMKRITNAPRIINDLPGLFREAASCSVSQTRKLMAIYKIIRSVRGIGPLSSLIPNELV